MTFLAKSMLACLLLGGALAATPPPAGAVDLPDCFTVTRVGHQDPRLGLHVYFPSTNPRYSCEMGTWQGGGYNRGVLELQQALNACYLRGLTEDGRFGARTRDALVAVQRQVGVKADGVYGPVTRGAIKWPAYHADFSGGGCVVGRSFGS